MFVPHTTGHPIIPLQQLKHTMCTLQGRQLYSATHDPYTGSMLCPGVWHSLTPATPCARSCSSRCTLVRARACACPVQAAAAAKETPQERLKRLMQAQLNKQQQKDHLSNAQKRLQVGVLLGAQAGASKAGRLAGWRSGVLWGGCGRGEESGLAGCSGCRAVVAAIFKMHCLGRRPRQAAAAYGRLHGGLSADWGWRGKGVQQPIDPRSTAERLLHMQR